MHFWQKYLGIRDSGATRLATDMNCGWEIGTTPYNVSGRKHEVRIGNTDECQDLTYHIVFAYTEPCTKFFSDGSTGIDIDFRR